MVKRLNSYFLLSILIWAQSGHAQGIEPSNELESASQEVYKIVVQLISSKPNLTFVFVLRVQFRNQVSFNYLQRFSNAQVYIAKDMPIMRPKDREIVISWERDPGLWDVVAICGHRNCDVTTQNLLNLHLDRRVLIQVRELDHKELNDRTQNLHEVRFLRAMSQKNFPKYYRSTFIVLRLLNEDVLHSSLQVRRTGHVIANQVMRLEVIKTDITQVKQTFDSVLETSNRTAKFTVGFFGIFFPDGEYNDRFMVSSCLRNEKFFVHAYTYLPVRLAVPLKWSTRLVSNLPVFLALELPMTLVCLFALPVIISIRHHRSLLPISSMFETALHLLSGDSSESLIRPTNQRTFLLLICGLVSLLIQFPINLLKGEVVSSTQEQRIHHSNCTVLSCRSTAYRGPWFQKKLKPARKSIYAMYGGKQSQIKVSRENMEEACPTDSINSSGMMNWTKLAFLLQYETICDEAELMKLQMTQLGSKLLFENIPGSHATQPLCSIGTNHGGHVRYWEHMQTTNQILEHALLKYQHLNASLIFKNVFETRFWNHRDAKSDWERASAIKSKVSLAVTQLVSNYEKYGMFGTSDKTKSSRVEEVFPVLLGYFILLLAASIVFVLELVKKLFRIFSGKGFWWLRARFIL